VIVINFCISVLIHFRCLSQHIHSKSNVRILMSFVFVVVFLVLIILCCEKVKLCKECNHLELDILLLNSFPVLNVVNGSVK